MSLRRVRTPEAVVCEACQAPIPTGAWGWSLPPAGWYCSPGCAVDQQRPVRKNPTPHHFVDDLAWLPEED